MKKIAVITGASGGIGLSTAKHFIEHNWNIVNLSRSLCELPTVKNIQANFTQDNWLESCKPPLTEALSQAEKIALIHNSAICISDQVQAFSEKEVRKVFDVNIIAPMLLNQLILPMMKKGSSIIYIGSTLSEKAVPYCASYVTSKHAVAGLMKATCQDLDNTGIHTCCVCPGVTDTLMLRERAEKVPGLLEKLSDLCSARRLIEPPEIAELILFCSEHPVLNGAIIHGNLGQIEH